MIDQMSKEEQHALIELLIYMVKADGVVDNIEEAIIQDYADLVAVDVDSIDGNLQPEVLIPKFQSLESRFTVIEELLRVSHLNGFFTRDEQAAILDVAEKLGVSSEMVRKMDAWVVDGMNWLLRGEELLVELEKESEA